MIEARDLGALGVGGTVRHHAEPYAGGAQLVDQVEGSGEWAGALFAQVAIEVGDVVGEFGVVATQTSQRLGEDLVARFSEVKAALAVASGIRPPP